MTVNANGDDAYIIPTLERFRNKLLDLTANNKLLNLRLANQKTNQLLRFVDCNLQAVLDGLIAGRNYSIDALPEPPSESSQEPDEAEAEAAPEAAIPQNLTDWAEQRGINPSFSLVCSNEGTSHQGPLRVLLTSPRLERVAETIRRETKSAIDETGNNVLYLTFGCLEWSDQKSRRLLAPLILLPVELRKATDSSGRRIFRLSAADDTPIANTTLRERLRRDHGLEQPIPEITSGAVDLDGYFMGMAKAISGLESWNVHPYLTLAQLNFNGLDLYEDLIPDAIQRSPLVRQLLAAEVSAEELPPSVDVIGTDVSVDQPEIAERVPVLIARADASQFAAVADVMAGHSRVIEGPPGTGKSQTITNIIANALYAGKRVLFVAEKKVALDVVHNRLFDAGIGPYCLRLESDRAHKKQVYDELAERLTLARPSQPLREGPRAMFNQVRDDLNRFTDQLNTPHEPEGQSRHLLLWQEVQLRQELERAGLELNALTMELPAAAALGRPDQETNLQTIEQLAALLKGLSPERMEQLFAGITALPADGFALDALLEQARRWKSDLEQLSTTIQPLQPGDDRSPAELRQAAVQCIALAERLPESLQPEAEILLPALSSPPIAESARSLLSAIRDGQETASVLLQHFEHLPDPLPPAGSLEQLVTDLKDWRFDQLGIPAEPEAKAALYEHLRHAREQIERLEALLQRHQGPIPLAQWSADQLDRVKPVLTQLCSQPDWFPSQRQSPLWSSDPGRVLNLISEQRELEELRQRLNLKQAALEAIDAQSLRQALDALQRCHQKGLTLLPAQTAGAESTGELSDSVSSLLSRVNSELGPLLSGIDVTQVELGQLQGLSTLIREALALGPAVLAQRSSVLWWEASLRDIQSAVEEERDLLAREAQLRRDGLVVPYGCSADELRQAAEELDSRSLFSRVGGYLGGRRLRAKGLCRRIGAGASRCDDLRAVAMVVELRQRYPRGWQRQRFGVELRSEELLDIGQRLQEWKAATGSSKSDGRWLEWIRRAPEASLREALQRFDDGLLSDLNTVLRHPLWNGDAGTLTLAGLAAELQRLESEQTDLAAAEPAAGLARAAGIQDGEAMVAWLKQVVDHRERADRFPAADWEELLRSGLEPTRIETVITTAQEARRTLDEAAVAGLDAVVLEATPETLRQTLSTVEEQLLPLLNELFNSDIALSEQARQEPVGRLLESLTHAASRYEGLLQRWQDAGLRKDVAPEALINAPLDVERAQRRRETVRDCLTSFQRLAGDEVATTAPELLEQVLDWISALRSGPLAQDWLEACLRPGSSAFIDRRRREGQAIAEALASERNSAEAFCFSAGLDPAAAPWTQGRSVVDVPENTLLHWLHEISTEKDLLQAWTRQQQLLKRLSGDDVRNLVRSLIHTNPGEEHWARVYRWNLTRHRLQQLNGHPSALDQLRGDDQMARRERFHQLEEELLTLDRQEVISAIHRDPAALPSGNNQGKRSEFTELALIQNEVVKQKGHRPLRQLFHRAGEALRGLKPCWMMPPGTVASLLPREAAEQFDLVIIDEASQMPPERALGLLSRAGQCVIVGDPKQLPPTSFFRRRSSSDEEAAESLVDGEALNEESILDLCTKAFHPVRRLKWHYRSRHGSLIAFSNRHFYNNELVVFPSCDRDFAIHRHLVTEPRYRSGLNPPEVERVCSVVLEQLQRHPDRSLGVVAMNEEQATAIATQLEKLAMQHERLRRRLDEQNGSEELFIKALENVQGDERDTIVISTTYGPAQPGGEVSLNLGPIKDSGGERRLNVLFTRARYAIELVTSIQSHQIRPRPGSLEGIHAFQAYLRYVESRSLDSDDSTCREPETPFERVVSEALQRHGFSVECRVGVANYFIDLAVLHPQNPGIYLLAIECDGPTYHAARAARDRDKYRQAVLEGLGWRVVRIWSADWCANPERETQKLLDQLRQRLAETRTEPSVTPGIEPSADSESAEAIDTGEIGDDLPLDSAETDEREWIDEAETTSGHSAEAETAVSIHEQQLRDPLELQPSQDIEAEREQEEQDEEEEEDLTESWDDIALEETTWDVSDYPDYSWIPELDRRVHLSHDERLAVIATIANSDRSVEEHIEELLHQQSELPNISSLLAEQSFDDMLEELTGGASWGIETPDEQQAAVRIIGKDPAGSPEPDRDETSSCREEPASRTEENPPTVQAPLELLPEDWQGSYSDQALAGLAMRFADGADNSSESAQKKLIAGLLTFHIRENSAEAQSYKEHLAMNTEGRFEDSECIASATLEEIGNYKNTKRYARYSFDANQPFRFSKKKNNTVRLACLNSRINLELIDVDASTGVISLAVEDKDASRLPEQTDLIHIPQDFSSGLRQSLAEQAGQWLEDLKTMPAVARHLFSQEESEQVRELVQEADSKPEQRVQLLSEYLFDAEGKSLILQGPPGSGKTTCAADVIATLVASGCNVGVCANSHLAIDLVLLRTAELVRLRGWEMSIAKFQSRTTREERELFKSNQIEVINNNTFHRLHDVYGATAHAFSQSRFDGLLDLLVIDEASQVPLANVLAMARCTRNLLLVGDQQQLPQPVVAEHPGPSGLACLSYATAGEEVIRETKGLFLNQSWRMPPDLCSIVSETFYQNRLRSHPENAANRIQWDGPASGLLFHPVEHTDSQFYATAEADAIEELIAHLLGSTCIRFANGIEQSSIIGWEDIAVMAPFNAQVNLLQRILGDEARVGTVDRFQGQEAPIAIYSITSSSLHSPRHLEFALNANRVNVAISRAQCLSIVVGSPAIEQLLQVQEHLSRERDLFRRLSAQHLTLAIRS